MAEYKKATHRHTFFVGAKKLGRSHWAMLFAHIGLAVTIIGISMVQNYSIERDVRLAPGEQFTIQDYTFTFDGFRDHNGSNYTGFIADFTIRKNDQYINRLQAEKRFYSVAGSVMTEAALDVGLFRDLYIAMGEQLDNSDAWAVRLYYKPFIRWIWFGGLLMALGGALAISDKRYRLKWNVGGDLHE